MSETITTLQARAMELVVQHGGVRPASRVLMCDAGYLSRLVRGEKTEPGDALLKRMGLRRKVSYVVAAPPQPVSAEAGKGVTVVVPWEPTTAMVNAGQCGCMDNDVTVSIYKAMLEAAPSESVAVSGEVSDQQILDIITRHEVYGYHPGAILEFARAVLALAGSGGKA